MSAHSSSLKKIVLACIAAILPMISIAETNDFLPAMPEGYFLQAYDDCGVENRQPHVLMKGSYIWTFQTSDTDAPLKERSAVFSYDKVQAVYTNLDPNLSYVLALTYANDHVYHRVQNLVVNNGIALHGPYTLPNGIATRVIVRVPSEATRDGKLTLTWNPLAQVNATVSIIELWANAPAKDGLHFDSLVGSEDNLYGQVLDRAFDAVSNAQVTLSVQGAGGELIATSGNNGAFMFKRDAVEKLANGSEAILSARAGQQEARTNIGTRSFFFDLVRYRPIPERVIGLRKNILSLDGAWRLDPNPRGHVRQSSLNATNWGNFQVPGQWAQQGYDIPKDKTVAVAKEFTIPANWAGYRIFLRFDAIHGGAHYWLNGRPLGYSENLFTPVEWEITDAAKAGATNRLDLEMKVATSSERLSYMSDYAGYTLGGIDRAVRIYSLPKVHVANLHLNAGLDNIYRDGVLQMTLGLDNTKASAQSGLSMTVNLLDARGRRVEHSIGELAVGPLQHGLTTVKFNSRVPNPLKWNAEQPNLYRLIIDLKQNGKTLEQIERNIGFRTIETKDHQLYVNGQRVKLAGVCHHEIDPLTGRANTMRHAEEDVKLFKSGNLNYVRTSHYPCTQEFLDAADRYGLYVESESPFCWVAPTDDLSDLKTMLTPVSAMIDFNHSHPSVIIWSLGNESHWSEIFHESDKMVKRLDPTRPTTIEHAFTRENEVTCDIRNRHYQELPYDKIFPNDPRPFLHGECFFLVYHERTDVTIDPGLRELWAEGSADPTSEYSRACVENLKTAAAHGAGMIAGVYPNAWNYIYASPRCIGSEIWSGVDDIAFLPGGKIVSSENGNAYWGIIDGWRRPKPELRLAKFVFSPVWFPARQLGYNLNQSSIKVPVENRYSFTDLAKFEFDWTLNGKRGRTHISVPPGSKGEIEIPIARGTPEGAELLMRVMDGRREIVNATLSLGERRPVALPQPTSGAPKWNDDGRLITVEGKGFSFVLDRAKGDFDPANPKHRAPILTFPSLHVTRHDYGDLAPQKPHYAQFPDSKTRVVEGVKVTNVGKGLEMIVRDHYQDFSGSVRWVIDADGVGEVSYDYTYTGAKFDSREVGIKALLSTNYDEVKWRRWSEWGRFPNDSICRTEGVAMAHRDRKWPVQPAYVKPAWPWSQDETELGTADFRSIKFNIYQASLVAPDDSGMQVNANADAHFRCCLAKNGVMMHVLTRCPLGPVEVTKGDRLAGRFSVRLLGKP